MALKLTHDEKGSVVGLHHGEVELFAYNYAPTYDPWESRKPYFHPVRSLAGNVVTGYRPHDHVWHKGIQMTSAHLSVPGDPVGQNFWGGNTYVHGKGYIEVDNVGRQQHEEWEKLEADGETAVLAHRLTWITAKDVPWLAERRSIVVGEVNEKEKRYSMDFRMVLKNMHKQTLLFGSPTTAGRPAAGYGGLFWRGPRDFLKGSILAGNRLKGPEVMGQRAPWLAYQGKHDGSNGRTTLLFVDRPGNPDYPNKWFVRNDPFAVVSFAFSFDREVPLEPGASMTLNHRIVVADGTWSREQVEAYLHGAGLHD